MEKNGQNISGENTPIQIKDRELYLHCIALASRPLPGRDFNYESLLAVAEDLLPDIASKWEKVEKTLELMDRTGGSFTNEPMIDGKIVPLRSVTQMIRTLPIPKMIQLADEYYRAISERIGEKIPDVVLPQQTNPNLGESNKANQMDKTLTNTTASQAKDNVADIVFWGDGNTFALISKASSKAEGWMKSTKAMQIDGVGCVVQVTTQQGDKVAEAITFVPGVKIEDVFTTPENGEVATVKGRKLVAI